MRRQLLHLRERLVAAVLTAAGVSALALGVLASGAPIDRLPDTSVSSTEGPSTGWSYPTFPPLDAAPGQSSGPTSGPSDRVATRIVIQALGIDLPVIAQPDPSYPSCNVAMYLQVPGLGQPGSGRSIYIYAHARTGMFLPLLTQVQRNGGRGLLHLSVDVYTSDDLEFRYEIARVLADVPPDEHFLDAPLAAKTETLWLQTSTGPDASYPKLQVVATPWLVVAADHAAAYPVARPVACQR